MTMEFEQHTEQFSEQVNTQARDWFMLMQSGTVSESEREQLQKWLQQAPEHARAYKQLQVIWQGLGELAEHKEGQALQRSVKQCYVNSDVFSLSIYTFFNTPIFIIKSLCSFINSYRIPTVLATLAVMFIAVFMMPGSYTEVNERYYASDIGELKPIVLNDGSKVTLGAKSRIRVLLGEKTRRVTLLSGEAFFDVEKDQDRPFIVLADQVAVKVVGTQFDVRKRFSGVSVAVQEGIVNVNSIINDNKDTLSQKWEDPIVLKAGQRVRKPKGDLFSSIESIAEFEMQAWRSGRLIYRNTPLGDLITDVNRYYDGEIILAGEDLAEKKITLTLHTDKIDLLPVMLRQALPVTVSETNNKNIVISHKK